MSENSLNEQTTAQSGNPLSLNTLSIITIAFLSTAVSAMLPDYVGCTMPFFFSLSISLFLLLGDMVSWTSVLFKAM
jgi:hypothetical protein